MDGKLFSDEVTDDGKEAYEDREAKFMASLSSIQLPTIDTALMSPTSRSRREDILTPSPGMKAIRPTSRSSGLIRSGTSSCLMSPVADRSMNNLALKRGTSTKSLNDSLVKEGRDWNSQHHSVDHLSLLSRTGRHSLQGTTRTMSSREVDEMVETLIAETTIASSTTPTSAGMSISRTPTTAGVTPTHSKKPPHLVSLPKKESLPSLQTPSSLRGDPVLKRAPSGENVTHNKSPGRSEKTHLTSLDGSAMERKKTIRQLAQMGMMRNGTDHVPFTEEELECLDEDHEWNVFNSFTRSHIGGNRATQLRMRESEHEEGAHSCSHTKTPLRADVLAIHDRRHQVHERQRGETDIHTKCETVIPRSDS